MYVWTSFSDNLNEGHKRAWGFTGYFRGDNGPTCSQTSGYTLVFPNMAEWTMNQDAFPIEQ